MLVKITLSMLAGVAAGFSVFWLLLGYNPLNLFFIYSFDFWASGWDQLGPFLREKINHSVYLWNTYGSPQKNHLLLAFVACSGSAAVTWQLIEFLSFQPVTRTYKSGIKRVDVKEFQAENQRKNKKNKRFQRGISIYKGIHLSREAETEHFALVGATGAGKTSAILNPMLSQAISRGDKVVAIDVKGDLTRALAERPGVTLMAPADARSARWDLAGEIRNKADCDTLANSLIYQPKKDSGGENGHFFLEQARLVESAIIRTLWREGKLTWERLAELNLNLQKALGDEENPGILHSYVSNGPAIMALQGADDSPQTKGTQSTIHNSICRWIEDASKAFQNPDFNLTNWLNQPDGGVLVLRHDERFDEVSSAMCTVFSQLLIQRALTMEEKDNRLWLFMDELGNFPRISNLARGMTLARSRGLRLVFSVQGVSQLEDVYSKNEAATFLGQAGTQIFQRTNGEADAEFAAKALGKTEFLERSSSRKGQEGTAQNSTSNYSQKIDFAVHSGEILSLKKAEQIGGGGEGFLRISGLPLVTKIKWPRRALEMPFLEFRRAPWVEGDPLCAGVRKGER